MNYEVISTGSKGNALLIENEILIDCGVSYRKLKEKSIKLILLTHEHKDHFNKNATSKSNSRRAKMETIRQELIKILMDYLKEITDTEAGFSDTVRASVPDVAKVIVVLTAE